MVNMPACGAGDRVFESRHPPSKFKMDTVKGFKDYSEEEAKKRELVRDIIIKNFKRYGFEPAETPIIEYEDFVKSGNEQDEVVSDIFRLQDRGKRKLALRYEFTFQLKRLAKNKKLPYKRYQIGEVFRDEPVSSNRFRQFTQCDVDIIGSTVKEEAEILTIAKRVLNELGIKNTVYIGNKKIFEDLVMVLFGLNDKNSINELVKYIDKLDKKKPSEIIKEIERDTKKSSALKKIQKIQLKNIFLPLLNTLRNNDLERLKEYYFGVLRNRKNEKFYDNSLFKKGYEEIIELERYCKYYGIKLQFNGALVRGLSYYNGNVFEIKVKDMKETVVGGGSYLVNGIQATGISFGLERISNLVKIKLEDKQILVVSLAQDEKAIKLAEDLRKEINCSIFYGKPSKALDYANSKNINYVIFIGREEVKKNKIKLKDMKTGKESLVSVKEIIKKIKSY